MPKRFRNLLDDAFPTLFLPKSSTMSINCPSSNCTKRAQRMQEKKNIEDRKIMIENILADSNYNDTRDDTIGDYQQDCQSQVVEEPISPVSFPDKMYVQEMFHFLFIKYMIINNIR